MTSAIDGKTLCGSRDISNHQRAIHLLHAWSCENRVCLAQAKVDDKSNEITAICGLMDQLLLKDNIVTTDALNTQKAVAATVLDASELVERNEWQGLQSAARVVRRRTEKGKTSEEVTYYISDLEINGEKIAHAIRSHWGVENHLHYALDVVLEEDSHIYRDRNGACNLAIIRKLVLAALKKTETKKKRSKKTKRLLAAVDPLFRTSCLYILFKAISY